MNGMRRGRIPQLSKSRFLAGLQCYKRLYLECYHRELADPVSLGQQALLDAGTQVGELARGLYPRGILIGADHFHHDEAVTATKKALSDPSVAAICEAGFVYEDVRIRADILARAGKGQFDLLEVKSVTQVKQEHLPDVAVQLYVLKGCDIPVRRACLIHLNRDYIYPGGEYELSELFYVADITREVEQLLPYVPPILDEMRFHLRGLEPPAIKAGKHCSQPYTCQFYGYCHIDRPEHHVSELPRAGEKLLQLLEEAGIEDIRDIPAGYPGLNQIQQRVCDCVANDRIYVDPTLARELDRLEYPIHFLDFETFSPALPLYVGTRPFQVIPFQWSVHILDRDGGLRHGEFLQEDFSDPREPFASSLLKTLGTGGSIVVYSSFEATRIAELAAALPHLSGELLSLLSRIVDLLSLVRKNCYHPEFHGSFSLKSVLPALVPELGYSDLEICDGDQASAAYAEMVNLGTSSDRRDFLRKSLLAYCERDTEALLRLYHTLRSSSADGIG